MRYKAVRSVLVVGLLAPMILVAQVATGGTQDWTHDPGGIHYPDLRTRQLAPADIEVNRQRSRNKKFSMTEVRFPNTVANWGEGPLEVRPAHGVNTTTAFQRLYSHDSDGNLAFNDHEVGTFVFHKRHHHWHFEGLALYQLFYDDAGGVGAQVSTGTKTTVCIRDNWNPESGTFALVHLGWGGYHDCHKTSVQGLTVGYGDTYTAGLAGQSLDISNVTLPACLWLRSIADPDNVLHESPDKLITNAREANNSMEVRFYVTAEGVRGTACP